jgi:hypothetical protein
MSKKRRIEAAELALRVEHVADLASLIGSDSFEGSRIPDALEDFVDFAYRNAREGEDDMAFLCRLFKSHTDTDESCDAEELAFQLDRHHLNGLLLHVATPVKNFYDPDSNNFSYSWGHYHTTWVYGTTFDKAWKQAKAWAKEQAAGDKARSLKKKGGAA